MADSSRVARAVNYLAANLRISWKVKAKKAMKATSDAAPEAKKATIDEVFVHQKEFDEDLNLMEEKIAKLDERICKRLDELLKETATLKKHVITTAVSAGAEAASVTITKVLHKFFDELSNIRKEIAKEIEEKISAVETKIAEVIEDCEWTRHIQDVTFTRMFGSDY